MAVKSGSVEVVEILIKSGMIDAETKNIEEISFIFYFFNLTPFDLAKQKNDEKMILLFSTLLKSKKKNAK